MTTTTPTLPAGAQATGKTSTTAGRVRKRLNSRTATLVSIVIALFWTIPTFGLFVSSFRPEDQIKTTGWWTFFTNPQFTLENYQEVLFGRSSSSGQLANYFVNSLAITIPSVLFPIAFASLAAYALAWINFRGRDWAYIAIFALQIVPLQMALVPLLRFFSTGVSLGGVTLMPAWDLVDEQKFVQVWFAHTCFALPFAVFLLHNFIAQLPKDLMEAARVDGATHPKIFRTIVLPLITPALAAFGIFQFLWVWNDLLVALIFAGGSSETAPLTVRLAEMAGTRGNEWQRLTAGAFVSIVVPLIVFLSLQRYFVRGLLAGSVKG
ncbi:carbohydrate ABC transporter permease [Micromonospora carbonacea]|jgi:alpha-glucoside transport system permease protein|uniref:Carbohydrate ABC transporter permease n=1 Tax=Micromonospora carbonacea TaxID=47853 RepID=A0A7H8XQ39_9ACTN|nr:MULTISPECIES: carbohydrate ABC transporter permease [Micromonospora]MBB5824675.1 alpha-glucoside transport system permease protein [Micromonospora carbonacea]MDG4815076.1 carbohydrate ABC transporter permease [Micromonospora sp. WMMD956]QLD27153.1 carbohydrate ABC transporter permease [Micromonospora carbonacea]WFE57687.1 carbohydrate ABC transporter permease [Micromonospora sp. WMMD712]